MTDCRSGDLVVHTYTPKDINQGQTGSRTIASGWQMASGWATGLMASRGVFRRPKAGKVGKSKRLAEYQLVVSGRNSGSEDASCAVLLVLCFIELAGTFRCTTVFDHMY